METDVHSHTTFSDGSDLVSMAEAAERADLDGLGITDHCIVTDDSFGRRARYDLVETYPRRREAIDEARGRTSVTLYDAAEVSYVEDEEDRLERFLDEAGFDYTVGSVHFAGPYDFTSGVQYADAGDEERRNAVERYYDAVVALVESELFDVLGHLDLPERLPPLRRYTTRSDYERVATALAGSETVPEVNAGRVTGSLGRVHPDPAFLDSFRDRGVEFVLGSDSHAPGEIERRVPALRRVSEEADLTPVGIATVLD